MPSLPRVMKLRSSTDVIVLAAGKKAIEGEAESEFSRKSTNEELDCPKDACSSEDLSLKRPPPRSLITQFEPDTTELAEEDCEGQSNGTGKKMTKQKKRPLFENFNEEMQERKRELTLTAKPPTQTQFDLMDRHPSTLQQCRKKHVKSTFYALSMAERLEEEVSPENKADEQSAIEASLMH